MTLPFTAHYSAGNEWLSVLDNWVASTGIQHLRRGHHLPRRAPLMLWTLFWQKLPQLCDRCRRFLFPSQAQCPHQPLAQQRFQQPLPSSCSSPRQGSVHSATLCSHRVPVEHRLHLFHLRRPAGHSWFTKPLSSPCISSYQPCPGSPATNPAWTQAAEVLGLIYHLNWPGFHWLDKEIQHQ